MEKRQNQNCRDHDGDYRENGFFRIRMDLRAKMRKAIEETVIFMTSHNGLNVLLLYNKKDQIYNEAQS